MESQRPLVQFLTHVPCLTEIVQLTVIIEETAQDLRSWFGSEKQRPNSCDVVNQEISLSIMMSQVKMSNRLDNSYELSSITSSLQQPNSPGLPHATNTLPRKAANHLMEHFKLDFIELDTVIC